MMALPGPDPRVDIGSIPTGLRRLGSDMKHCEAMLVWRARLRHI